MYILCCDKNINISIFNECIIKYGYDIKIYNIDELNEENIKETYKIFTITINIYKQIYNYKNFIFNIEPNIDLFDNKINFYNFLRNKKYKNLINPKCYYYNDNNKIYKPNKNILTKKIIKPALSYAGKNMKIIYNIQNYINNKNIIIQKYYEHEYYYTGHFLVKDGTIHKYIYFKSQRNTNKKLIVKGSIKNYIYIQEIDSNLFAIIIDIFKSVNYSGFACVDFTIIMNKLLIFEINPRIGGSLLINCDILKEFLDVFIQVF
jgi:predicted ATP-grasp superfamily ATP-dependent carboligase